MAFPETFRLQSPCLAPRSPTHRASILNLLSSLRAAPSPREMAQALGKGHAARRAIPKLLQRLKRRGLIEEVRRDRFRLAQPRSARPGGQREEGAAERRGDPPGG